ncbi:MAG: DNA polymerase Y family protein [Deltaproteobacteria bacterium]|nr:DNA polymerase Y family protein [Deltaproteobacteria bacterium]MCB9786616.1 DNA polymerase Y family protein [Deltaproteobacteria bacterium]
MAMSDEARRVACVHVPALPLQLLRRRHPEWAGVPAVVVEADTPLGRVLWLNEAAHREGILRGMRYAEALSLARGLRAGVVSPLDVERGQGELLGALRRFSPHIEKDEGAPGTFWLDVAGMGAVFPSLPELGRLLGEAMGALGFEASVAIGFRRFATRALAAEHGGLTLHDDPEAELEAAWQVPLSRLGIDPELRDALSRLGITRVGQLQRLPERGLRERFGAEAARLRRAVMGEEGLPRPSIEETAPVSATRELLAPVAATTELLFTVKGMLSGLLRQLEERAEALVALHLEMVLDHAPACRATVRPADPTLDEEQLLELVHLKLSALSLAAGVEELRVTAEGTRTAWEQTGLFTRQPRRDLAAANRALARVRAELGDRVVVCARLREGHLPEARFRWEPLARLGAARPRFEGDAVAVRRLLWRSQPLRSPERHLRNDGWLPGTLSQGAVVRMVGPYVISGGWWHQEVHRDYHFIETKSGEVLWAYYDRRRRRWRLQGTLE